MVVVRGEIRGGGGCWWFSENKREMGGRKRCEIEGEERLERRL